MILTLLEITQKKSHELPRKPKKKPKCLVIFHNLISGATFLPQAVKHGGTPSPRAVPFPVQHCVTTGKHHVYIRVGCAACGSDDTEWNRWKTRGRWEDSSEPDPLLSDLRNVETTPMAGRGSILLEKRVNEMFVLSLALADAQHSDPLCQEL